MGAASTVVTAGPLFLWYPVLMWLSHHKAGLGLLLLSFGFLFAAITHLRQGETPFQGKMMAGWRLRLFAIFQLALGCLVFFMALSCLAF